uniref:Transmembrane protein n=1 Tax=Burkholderia sp. (strain CCGE1003) TaxID=640512 RepID=E1TAM7_BURSG
MGWPIIAGETVQPESGLSWKPWMLLFACLTGACIAWAVWSWPHGKSIDIRFWLRAVVTPLLLGCVLLGLRINRYEQSVAASVASQEATEKTRLEWQKWAQRTLRVIACATISPEQKLAAAMTATPPTATASPHKGRKFYGWPDDGKTDPLQWACEQLIRQLSEVHPGWQTHVRSVHVQSDATAEDIECAWQAAMVASGLSQSAARVVPFEMSDWHDMFEELDPRPRLFVAVQTWPSSREPQNFSELATALLVSGDDGKNDCDAPAARIGRPMTISAETLDEDLAMLFEYAGTNTETITRVWLSGVSADLAGSMAVRISSGGDGPVASYDIDHYLGAAHIAQYWFGLIAAAELGGKSTSELFVGHTANALILHLITGR